MGILWKFTKYIAFPYQVPGECMIWEWYGLYQHSIPISDGGMIG